MHLAPRRAPDGGLETTRWLTLCYVPLVPLSRWRVRVVGRVIPRPREDGAFLFEPLERLPLSLGAAFTTAVGGWCLAALGLGPLAACLVECAGTARFVQMAVFFPACVWPAVLVEWVERRRRAVIQGSPVREGYAESGRCS
jgi:hypothetical protein